MVGRMQSVLDGEAVDSDEGDVDAEIVQGSEGCTADADLALGPDPPAEDMQLELGLLGAARGDDRGDRALRW